MGGRTVNVFAKSSCGIIKTVIHTRYLETVEMEN